MTNAPRHPSSPLLSIPKPSPSAALPTSSPRRTRAAIARRSLLHGLGLLLATGVPAAPVRLTDLFTAPPGLSLPPQVEGAPSAGGAIYFAATDPLHGYELWRSDGSAAGTVRLTDLCPGPCDSGPSPLGPSPNPAAGGGFYFLADDGERGRGLWVTLGGPGQEVRVDGVCATAACFDGLAQGMPWRGSLWFLATEPAPETGAASDPELWVSDFTAAGTHRVAGLCADLAICSSTPGSQTYLGAVDPSGEGLLVFAYADGLRLFRTDGTRAGTVLLHDFPPAAPPPPSLRAPSFPGRTPRPASRRSAAVTAAPGQPFYFLRGAALWLTDGTPGGTRLVRDLGDLLRYPDDWLDSALVVDGVWYGIFSFGEWIRSDGTAAGTAHLADVPSEFLPTLARLDSDVFAVTVGGLYRAGATPETTVQVADWAAEDVLRVIEQPGELFIQTWLGGGRLWRTDGTAGGTRQVHLPRGATIDQYDIERFADGVVFSRGGDELWKVDGAGHPSLLHDYQPRNGDSLAPGAGVLGDRAFFMARIDANRTRLFASDGTPSGTAAVSDAADETAYGPIYLAPHTFSRVGAGSAARLIFDAGYRLWVTDGSARGTGRLRPGSAYGTPNRYVPIAAVGDRLLFLGHRQGGPSCDPGEREPWITDGSARGTRQVLDLNPFAYDGGGSQCEGLPLSSDPGPGIAYGSLALFAADDLVHGRELFATDGTAAGTRVVADIDPATEPNTITDPPGVPPQAGVGSDPRDFVRLGSRVLFTADDGTAGREIWITNGTARGTHRVIDLVPGPRGSDPHDLVAFRGAVYFVARVGDREVVLRTDGTDAGTTEVSDPASPLVRAHGLTPAGDRLYFVGFDESRGEELWTSEGTVRTTHVVVDLRRGPRGSQPRSLLAVGARVVFAADDGSHGLEAWVSDGTARGTLPLGDLAPGRDASAPGPFTLVGGRLLFGADDGVHGRELWALPLAALPQP